METYLFAWNPVRWEWEGLAEDLARLAKSGHLDGRWSCAHRKRLAIGSKVFLIKLGPRKPTGIMGVGVTRSEPFEEEHYADPKRRAMYVDIRWTDLRA